jgi:hypothetical protein
MASRCENWDGEVGPRTADIRRLLDGEGWIWRDQALGQKTINFRCVGGGELTISDSTTAAVT